MAGLPVNGRQREMLNRLLDGFEGRLTSSKWARIVDCSQDTALRDIGGLIGTACWCRTPRAGEVPAMA